MYEVIISRDNELRRYNEVSRILFKKDYRFLNENQKNIVKDEIKRRCEK